MCGNRLVDHFLVKANNSDDHCEAYNVAHAIFSGTAPIIQTELVLTAASKHPGPHINLTDDGRFRPAYYLMSIEVLALLALTFGHAYCQSKKVHEQSQQDLPTARPVTDEDEGNEADVMLSGYTISV